MEPDDPAAVHRLVRSLRKTFSGTAHATVPTTTQKRYTRMPQLQLPPPEPLEKGLSAAILERQSLGSEESPRPTNPLQLQACSNLLGNAVAARGPHQRGYPSGGGLTPIELYLVGQLEHAATPMVYHYAPATHTLEALWPVMASDIDHLITSKNTPTGSHTLILTARWGQSSQKYRGFAYYLALLEAGHLAQNILLCATALSMPSRPIGGFDDECANRLLDIHLRGEDTVYVVTFSPKSS